uniref:Uncharacterized protein LOC110217099 n=1 Tax=Phascolarctos cinereus TaxID=38626 RepID=A0A6P5LH12_PHACI|nr:uncharacterized protein LOC110217099 [Phascolarctos cinereus]
MTPPFGGLQERRVKHTALNLLLGGTGGAGGWGSHLSEPQRSSTSFPPLPQPHLSRTPRAPANAFYRVRPRETRRAWWSRPGDPSGPQPKADDPPPVPAPRLAPSTSPLLTKTESGKKSRGGRSRKGPAPPPKGRTQTVRTTMADLEVGTSSGAFRCLARAPISRTPGGHLISVVSLFRFSNPSSPSLRNWGGEMKAGGGVDRPIGWAREGSSNEQENLARGRACFSPTYMCTATSVCDSPVTHLSLRSHATTIRKNVSPSGIKLF